MIKEIKIYPRYVMDQFAASGGMHFPYHDLPWHLISIYGDGEADLLTNENKKVFQEMGCRHFLSLNFWDIVKQTDLPPGIGIVFHKGQAKQTVDMIKKIQEEKEDSVLVAHCSAGISRSGAIGVFACDYCRLDYGEFMKKNPSLMANPYVLRLLRREAGMIPDFGSHDGIDPTECERGDTIFEV